MRNIPSGNGALSIAHAGHELRMHGFLEKANPYIFILTDGSNDKAPSRMGYTQIYTSSLFPEKKDIFMTFSQSDKLKDDKYIKEVQILNDIMQGKTEFSEMFAGEMAHVMVEKKIDYVVCDASEGTDVMHEVCVILTDIAIRVAEKMGRKKIMRYEYAVSKPYNHDLTDECIHIKLDDAMASRKLFELAKYHISILGDIKHDVAMDETIAFQVKQMPGGIEALQNMLQVLNPDYFTNEYIRPYIYKDMAPDNPLAPFREKLLGLMSK